MIYKSTSRLNVGEVGIIFVNGIPTKDTVICKEITSDQTKHRCNYCHFMNDCRTTHNVCNPHTRDDKKWVYFEKCE